MRSVVTFFFLISCSFWAEERTLSAKDSYYFSPLPPSWESRPQKESDYAFYGPQGSSLMIQSFCDEFQSASLNNLALTTFQSLDKAVITTQEEFLLQERIALMSQGEAQLDGVKMKITLINTRRDHCYYDFLQVQQGSDSPSIIDDFIKGLRFK